MKSLRLSKPHLVVMVGIPGAGKSFFAEHFAHTFHAPYVSFGTIRTELFPSPSFDHGENELVSRIGMLQLDELLKTERTVVFDGFSEARTERQDLTRKAKAAGYEPLFVWVQTESVAAKSRALKSSRGAETLSSDQFDAVVRRFTAPNASERAAVISGKHTYASQLKIVLGRLVDARAVESTPAAISTVPSRPTIARHRTIIR